MINHHMLHFWYPQKWIFGSFILLHNICQEQKTLSHFEQMNIALTVDLKSRNPCCSSYSCESTVCFIFVRSIFTHILKFCQFSHVTLFPFLKSRDNYNFNQSFSIFPRAFIQIHKILFRDP